MLMQPPRAAVGRGGARLAAALHEQPHQKNDPTNNIHKLIHKQNNTHRNAHTVWHGDYPTHAH